MANYRAMVKNLQREARENEWVRWVQNEPQCDYDYDDDPYAEPIGSCDQCDGNLYADDVWCVDGSELCSQCAWHAMGCPSPSGPE